MDLTRKAAGTSATSAADAYTAFIELCNKKGIELTTENKRKLNTEFRNLNKKMGKDFLKLDFEGIASVLNGAVPAIDEYIAREAAASFLTDAKTMASDVAEEASVSEPKVISPVEPPAAIEKDSEGDTVEVSAEPVTVVTEQAAPATPMEEKPVNTVPEEEKSSGALSVNDTPQKTAKQSNSFEKLDLIYGLRGGKKVDSKRKKEIAKEIHSLKVQRDSSTRSISMRSDDMAILTGIMAYAGSKKESRESQFLDCDMNSWTGIMHAAVECLINKLAEENKTHYLDAIVKSLDAEAKRRAGIDGQIEKLLAEKDGV